MNSRQITFQSVLYDHCKVNFNENYCNFHNYLRKRCRERLRNGALPEKGIFKKKDKENITGIQI